MAPWTFLLAVAALTKLVDAIPVISYPINAQVPPVARVSELFSYSFSSSTFTSTSSMTYTLLDAPSWLSLESSTRTLSGTPSSSDAGADVVTGVPFGLVATDATGSIMQNVTLVVSNNPAPVNSIPVSTQLQTFGLFSAPSTLLYHPSTSFSLNFSSETFTDNSTSLSYYAVSLNYTPLPSWVTFDSESLSFAGRTPDYQSLIQPPQNFGFRLIASDVQGFSGTSATFEIEVGVHLFAFSKEELQANATPGVAFNFTGLADNLQLDGASTDASSLSSITAKTPSWLMFNNSTLELTGTPPADAAPENITVFATDIYGDVANATVYLGIGTSLFNGEIGGVNATIGEEFSYSFGLYLKNRSDVEMTAQVSPQTPWLAFDSQNFTLYGQVPSTIKPSNITITLTAISKTFRNSASQYFELAIINGAILPSSTSTPTDASATPSKSATNVGGHRGLTNGQIAAIVVPTVFVLIALLVCIFLCCWRRRAKEPPESPQKEMSRPIEARESLAVGSSSIREPTKLHLDTSEFLVDRNPKGYTNSPMGGVKRNADGSVRRSQTMSAMSGARNSAIRDSQSSENRTRSYSENALSRTDDSRRSTQGSANQDSAYPRIGSGTSSSNRLSSSHNYSLSRNYSNYSRKGHTRRSTHGGSSDRHVKDSNISLRPSTGASILNLADSSFSSTPLDNFSVLSNNSSMQHTPEFAYIPTGPRRELPEVDPTKRYSRLITSSDIRRGGIGHGVRDTMLPSLGGLAERRSVGHGQERASTSGSSNVPGTAFASDSTGWQTVNTNEEIEQRRYSIASNFTESTDAPYVGDSRYMGIRPVPKSPKIPPSVIYSESSATSRPLSRRTVGTSPFFGGGGSSRASRKSPKPLKEILYADSPTVPEESAMASQEDLEQSIMHSLRRQSTQRDSFGISYGSAREGTDRLRSFIQTRMDRTRTENSMQSSTSRDSRFESAYTDDQDDPGSRTGEGQVVETPGAEWEDYLPEDYSDGSGWESQPSPRRDSKGNIIEYAPDDSPHVEQAEAAAAPDKAQLLESSSDSGRMSEIITNTRLMPGPGRRPVSVDTEGKRGASHNASHSMGHIDQEDYTAYI